MPHSTYSKIFDILLILNNGRPREVFELSNEIHEKKLESFAIWRKAEGLNRSVKSYCSPSSIRRLIRFIDALELIKIDENKRMCYILPTGENALIGDNYPVQLGAQLIMCMKESIGISLEELEKIIKSIKPPKVADRDTIYQIVVSRRGVNSSEEEFRRLLYLLQRCEKISASVRKIYTPSVE
jgi:hypothetical protein